MRKIIIAFAASVVAGLGFVGCETEGGYHEYAYGRPYYDYYGPDVVLLPGRHHFHDERFEHRRDLHALREHERGRALHEGREIREHALHEGHEMHEMHALR